MRPSKATIEQLDKLAQDLKLTEQQRKFAEALAADPERNRTRAARVAGSKKPETLGARWYKLSAVRSYINALTSEAQKLAKAKLGEEIATLGEALALKTVALRHAHPQQYMRVTQGGAVAYDHEAVLAAPPGAIKDIDRDETGDIRPKFHDAQAAADALIEHYTGSKRPAEGNKTLVLNLIGQLPEDVVRSAAKGLLGEGEEQ